MWWRLGVLGAATAALLVLFFAPIADVHIKVDLPPTAAPTSGTQVYVASAAQLWITGAIVVAIVLGVAGWIAWRIVRRHGISN